MKKVDLVNAILEDMIKKNPSQENLIRLEWTKWLSRQHKCKLEDILRKRTEA